MNMNNLLTQSQSNQNRVQLIKQQQRIRQLEKINEFEHNNKSLIQQQNQNKSKKNNLPIDIQNLEYQYNIDKTSFWKGRTNIPYKGFLHTLPIEINQDIKCVDDFIIHKITNTDKKELDTDLKNFLSTKEKQDKDFELLYSKNKKTDHLKEFEFNHKYKYKILDIPSTTETIKKDSIEYYKNEQKKIENNNKKMDEIINTLITNEIINNEPNNSTQSELVLAGGAQPLPGSYDQQSIIINPKNIINPKKKGIKQIN